MSSIKTIFLDWDGTLSHSRFWGHLSAPDHKQHYIYTGAQEILFQQKKELIKPWMRGHLSSEKIMGLIAPSVGVKGEILFEEFVRGCQQMELLEKSIPMFVAQLQDQGIQVVIATDNMDSFTRWTVPSLRLDDIFDTLLNSSDLKALKSDQDGDGRSIFFSHYLKKHHLKPNETILIDDSEDREGVIQGFGIHYMRLNQSVLLPGILQEILKTKNI